MSNVTMNNMTESQSIIVEYDGQAYALKPGGNLLQGLLDKGVRINNSCRQGLCHACIVTSRSQYDETWYRDALVDESQSKFQILSCQCQVHDRLTLERADSRGQEVPVVIEREYEDGSRLLRVSYRHRWSFGQLIALSLGPDRSGQFIVINDTSTAGMLVWIPPFSEISAVQSFIEGLNTEHKLWAGDVSLSGGMTFDKDDTEWFLIYASQPMSQLAQLILEYVQAPDGERQQDNDIVTIVDDSEITTLEEQFRSTLTKLPSPKKMLGFLLLTGGDVRRCHRQAMMLGYSPRAFIDLYPDGR